jgi:hypothetical protein
MKRILKWLARLYPSTWRKRYGAEYEALLEQNKPRAGDAVDVIWGAFKMQMTSWSFVRTVLVCSLAGAVAAVAMSFALPKKYVSQTLISVDTPNPAAVDKYIAGQVRDSLDSPFLASIIEQQNLYPRERARMPLSDVVDSMKKNITILRVQTRDGKSASALILYFAYSDPHVAQRVDEELTSGFAVSNLRAAINHSSDVSRPPMTFRVEHVANLPQNPTFPKPRLFGAGGLLAGLVGGLVVATIAGRRRLTLTNI